MYSGAAYPNNYCGRHKHRLVYTHEAAAFASIYAMLISMFVYKTLRLRDMPAILQETLKLSSLSLIALSAATALGNCWVTIRFPTMWRLFSPLT